MSLPCGYVGDDNYRIRVVRVSIAGNGSDRALLGGRFGKGNAKGAPDTCLLLVHARRQDCVTCGMRASILASDGGKLHTLKLDHNIKKLFHIDSGFDSNVWH